MKKKNVLALMMAATVTAATLTGCGNSYTAKLTDTNPVKVELGTELSTDVRNYVTVMNGEEAVDAGEVFKDIVLDTGNIDVNVPGTYTLIITYENNQLVIPVIVEDTMAPKVEVKDLTLAAGTEVTVEEYVTVTDAQETEVAFVLADGSRTDKFTFDGTPLEVTIEAVDAAGNKSEAVMEIDLLDTTAPVITAEDVVLYVNDEFELMQGVSAVDDVDGDLADKVAVSGTVNTAKEDKYTLTYTVADKAGNTASVERLVEVVKKSSSKKSTGQKTGSTGTAGNGNTATGNTNTGNTGNTTSTTPAPSNPAPSNPPADTDNGGSTNTGNGAASTPPPPANVGQIPVDPGIQDIIDNGGDPLDNADWDNVGSI